MPRFNTAISALEARYGKIDNLKLSPAGNPIPDPDAVLDDLASVIFDHLEGRAPIATTYSDAELSDAKIDIS